MITRPSPNHSRTSRHPNGFLTPKWTGLLGLWQIIKFRFLHPRPATGTGSQRKEWYQRFFLFGRKAHSPQLTTPYTRNPSASTSSTATAAAPAAASKATNCPTLLTKSSSPAYHVRLSFAGCQAPIDGWPIPHPLRCPLVAILVSSSTVATPSPLPSMPMVSCCLLFGHLLSTRYRCPRPAGSGCPPILGSLTRPLEARAKPNVVASRHPFSHRWSQGSFSTARRFALR